MSSTLLRVAAKRRLLDRIQTGSDDDTGVFYSAPAKWRERKVIHFGETRTISFEPRGMKQGRKRRKDVFTLEVFVVVGPGAVKDYAEDQANDPGSYAPFDEACEALIQLIDDSLADDPNMSTTDDPVAGAFTGFISTIDGPDPQLWEGPGSQARVLVQFESHLS